MTKDQDFPVSIEVQLLGGSGSGTRTTADLCPPGTNVVMDGRLVTRHCTESRSKTYHGDQWVTVEVEVRGGAIRHVVEGETVLAYTDPQLDPADADARRLLESGKDKMLRRGTISLQSESHFYFHAGDRKSPVARGIEVQIHDSHRKGADRRLTDHDSGRIIPGIPPRENTARPAGEWNRFHIVCKGNELTVRLNGVVVNEVKLDDPKLEGRPESGAIGFQDHALPLALRRIRIRSLPHP
jgi:hypothetical protein